MLLRKALSIAVLLIIETAAQVTLTGTNEVSSDDGTALPTATYIIYDSTSSLLSTSTATNATMGGLFSSVAASNSSSGRTAASSASVSLTYLVGGQGSSPTSMNGTALHSSTSASSSAQPTNTQPCNGHVQFCNRKFSNITMVAAHNSPFVRPGNAASNQVLDVTTQLKDGIRMRKWPSSVSYSAALTSSLSYLLRTAYSITYIPPSHCSASSVPPQTLYSGGLYPTRACFWGMVDVVIYPSLPRPVIAARGWDK